MNVDDTTITDLLQTNEAGQKLSIYQSTHPVSNGQTVQEDSTRFKNALQAIRANELYEDDLLGETMSSLDDLLNDVEFWKHRTVGLAVFADQHGYQTVSLSVDVTEAHYISEHYQVSPLVLEYSLGSHYYILDINHTRPRLLEGNSLVCTELMIKDMPESFEAMTENVEYTKDLQHQSGGTSAYHGHDDDAAVRDDTARYYRTIVKAVEAFLVDHTEPLLLVGVQNRVGTLRHMLSYPHALESYIEGSGEAMNEQALHDVSIPLINEHNNRLRSELIEAFREATPTTAISGVEKITTAAAEGRVATLLLPAFRQTTDTVRDGFDPAIVLQLDPEDTTSESLARSVLAQGGEVVAIDQDSFDDEEPRALCRF